MRRKEEIIHSEEKTVSDTFHFFMLALGFFLIVGGISQNNAFAQNANERDIKLPKASNSELPSIYLIGDSTVRNGAGDGANGQWGWGSFLHEWFDDGKVNVVNRAIGGRSSRTYITQGYWDQQKELLKPGDVVLIQFGHNDASPVDDSSRARGVLDGIGDESRHLFNQLTKEEETVYTYGEYLRKYVSEIREAGATPMICSPVPTNGTVISKLVKYDQWAEQVATAEGVAFLDLNDIIGSEYEQMSDEEVDALFVEDRVHSTKKGAKFSAKMVVSALKGLQRNPVGHLMAEEAESVEPRSGDQDKVMKPAVKGYGEGLFEVGELIYQNNFESENDWLIQVEDTEAPSEPRIDFFNGYLEVLLPGRGATVWNRNEFSGNIAITYKVKAPSTYVNELGVVVRDMNTFWHATHPGNPMALFDADKYTGAFPSYHTLQGYYASMGGRDNTTTRFRRYPRIDENGDPVDHIALSYRDGQQSFLIQPGKTHTIQLVVFDDVVQYLVDGKVFYEIKEGDTVEVALADGTMEEVTYTTDRFPAYTEGWFGFRLVNTHHVYSDFRVYRLVPAE
ncbi:DUF6250 domain-containing protein [Gracilimonas mengyeensis]|uniref:Lysophospholipase L1 n=1 Tax=Gracilimonas mengyeensis TaxID=1302730 RepID=A0A521C343_9BACT|nr:DUF6250 domain-containing protein [Gracilimonas mengyeensis]SMO53862.1 Lysophospholipase L1 [Gracilimonas mengyeensis]